MPENYDRSAVLIGDMIRKTGGNFSSKGAIKLAFNLREAVETCIDCDIKEQCRRWLDEAPENATPPDFCPNVRFLKTLKPQAA